MKKFIFILSLILILTVSICSASKNINADNMAIGGITAGSKSEYIKSIYGEPNKIKVSEKNKNAETWYYGDSFCIDLVDGIASAVVSSAANGLATPDEISVGMKKKILTSKYGRPNELVKNGSIAIYTYQADNGTEMIFIIRNKIISEIRIEQGGQIERD